MATPRSLRPQGLNDIAAGLRAAACLFHSVSANSDHAQQSHKTPQSIARSTPRCRAFRRHELGDSPEPGQALLWEGFQQRIVPVGAAYARTTLSYRCLAFRVAFRVSTTRGECSSTKTQSYAEWSVTTTTQSCERRNPAVNSVLAILSWG
jgi:hypothetical protein